MQTQRRSCVLKHITHLTLIGGMLLTLAPPALSLRGMNYLATIQGEAYIRRFWIPQQAKVGDLVRSAQTIQVEPHSQVTLVCSNHTTHLLLPGTHTVGDFCPPDPAVPKGSRNPTRQIFDSQQPYILSPRHTALLSGENLLIQWHPPADLDPTLPVQVKLTGEGVEWKTIVPALGSLSQIFYEEPSTLKPDRSYSVTVQVGERSSVSRFSVLLAAERDRVDQQVAALQALNLEPDAEAIGLALIYLNYQHSDSDRHSNSLNLDALRVVQTRTQARTQGSSGNSQLYLLEAAAYLAMDLPLEARQSFQQALSLAKAHNEPERLADSYKGLGEIAARQTETATAREFFQKALTLYENLGDSEQVNAVREEIQRLEMRAFDR